MQRLNCGCSSGCDGKVVDFAVLGNVNVMGLHYSEIDSVSGVNPVARLAADDIALVENFYDLLLISINDTTRNRISKFKILNYSTLISLEKSPNH